MQVLRKLLSYATSQNQQVLTATVYSIINKLFDLAPPVLIGAGVDVVVSKENSFLGSFGVTDSVSQLWVLAGITLVIWGMESVFDYFAEVAWRNLAQRLQHELRVDAYSHLQSIELEYFESRSTGDLLAVLNDDVNQLERFLDGGAHEIIVTATTVLVVGGIFFYLVPSIAWMAFLPMPFLAWGSVYFQRAVAPRYAAVREQAGIVNSQLANNLGGIATIKSFTTESHERGEIEKSSIAYSEKNEQAIKVSALFVPVLRMVIVVGFAAIMVYGGKMALSGVLNVGAYSVLVFMTQRLLWPLTRIGDTIDLYQRAMASAARIFDVLAISPKIIDGELCLKKEKVRGELQFNKISFAYNQREQTIRDVSIEVPAGKTIGIVGSTGSGKTTLVKLLLRFYEVDSGAILLDGHPIEQLRLSDLRRAISLVSQDVFLVDGTVRENITYGSFDASDSEVERAADIAEIGDFVRSLPQGFETLVGERGQKLSGGQRQRISIARAVLKNAPVIVLDEATSSVDNETEAAIQRAMDKLGADRTMIIIAHRLSTVRNADSIVVMENGNIVQHGSHEELLKQEGVYDSLWKVQTGIRSFA